MSVAILIKFKEQERERLYIPVATEGAYGTEWAATAEKLGLHWVPLFQSGISVDIVDLPVVLDEFRQLRAALVGNPKKAATVARIDFILEILGEVNPNEIADIFIG
ncbi:hypothetical protein JRI60_36095 [Archangium violaceum]|uniref:hypothetical protein n=1 Tax=Archangium violaceum TaxID=83451 RepID=UPI00194F9487|nr:hypothetical protein [Archangium violaceum]QRN94513.1 hypothetical protein JRI60_36095 [Archangium violaceum]